MYVMLWYDMFNSMCWHEWAINIKIIRWGRISYISSKYLLTEIQSLTENIWSSIHEVLVSWWQQKFHQSEIRLIYHIAINIKYFETLFMRLIHKIPLCTRIYTYNFCKCFKLNFLIMTKHEIDKILNTLQFEFKIFPLLFLKV